jgi:hypothetical protein
VSTAHEGETTVLGAPANEPVTLLPMVTLTVSATAPPLWSVISPEAPGSLYWLLGLTKARLASTFGGVLFPVSETLALAGGFLLEAVSVALSVEPAAVGSYWMVTLHDFLGPRLVPVQPSAVTEKAEEPVSVTLRALVPLPPEFLSVNVCEEVVFASIVP